MSRKTDVIVIGSGIAGLAAARNAAQNGRRVRVLGTGMGCLAISPGCIDLLGYDNTGRRLDNPFAGFDNLPADHPYALLGTDYVKQALDSICVCLAEQGVKLKSASDENGNPANYLMPTIAGTLKPTFMIPEHDDYDAMRKAAKVLVMSVAGFRDCRPRLIISQLRRYRDWSEKDFSPVLLPPPFKEKGRSLNALDLAHVADRKDGCQWLLETVKGLGKNYDVALIPPMLGVRPDSGIRASLPEALGCPVVEMLSIPPGVGGLRIRKALVDDLTARNVEFFENAEVVGASINADKSINLTVHSSNRDIGHEAKAVVVATGGIINGGVKLDAGKARESVFGLEIPVPADVEEWTNPEIFGQHLLTKLGVKVDSNLRPVDKDGNILLENVFFAGRTIGGYDYASEKSGHGVAAATGWKAGELAAACVQNQDGDHSASGADK